MDGSLCAGRGRGFQARHCVHPIAAGMPVTVQLWGGIQGIWGSRDASYLGRGFASLRQPFLYPPFF